MIVRSIHKVPFVAKLKGVNAHTGVCVENSLCAHCMLLSYLERTLQAASYTRRQTAYYDLQNTMACCDITFASEW
jgi:hypothetical protein